MPPVDHRDNVMYPKTAICEKGKEEMEGKDIRLGKLGYGGVLKILLCSRVGMAWLLLPSWIDMAENYCGHSRTADACTREERAQTRGRW